ncbi:MAG: dihydroorotate dehydrogenase, partial [Candidatus Helarchaeota archaeon]
VGTDCGVINSMGLPNPGINEFIDELKSLNLDNFPLFVSIFGYTENEFEILAKKLSKIPMVKAIELNISCPHSVISQIGQDPEITRKVVEAVRESTDLPLFVKLTPNVTDITKIAKAAELGGADAIIAINTVRAIAIDIETGMPILSNIYGGLSGPAIKPIAIRAVYDIFKTVNIPIIGVGGILKWQDVIEFFYAGASAVQIGTGIIREDLDIFRKISIGLIQYLNRKNILNIQDLIGKTHKLIRIKREKK